MTSHRFGLTLAVVLLGALSLSGCASTATRRATAALLSEGSSDTAKVWVCHRGRKGKWLHIATPALGAHQRHGDRVSRTPQSAGGACVR